MAGFPSRDLALAVTETQKWIEAVTGRRFPAGCSLRAGLEDGILLCELMEYLSPGSIRKINRSPSRLAHLDNIQQFLLSCKDLGLKDPQLFDMMDLQQLPQAGNEKTMLDEKTKSVCITMFWLSQAVAEMQDYSGPQLNLSAFTSFIPHSSSHPSEEEGPLTFEEEQTADQLLADIQSAVDEMLHDFQTNTLSPESFTPPPTQPPLPPPSSSPSQPPLPPSSSPPSQPPLPLPSSSPHTPSIDEQLPNTPHVAMEVQMNSGGRGFGFQVCGGSDTSMLAQVDMVLPGSSAEQGGLRSGDKITAVNGQNVMSLTHTEIVSIIRKAATEGHITMGILRAVEDTEEPSKPDWREQETQEQTSQVTDIHQSQAAVLKRMYPKSYHFLDSQLGSSLTPVMEEDLSPPLPPLPGESSIFPLPAIPRESSQSPLPRLPGESSQSPLPEGFSQSPLPRLPGESSQSPLPPLPGEPSQSPLPPLPGESSPVHSLPRDSSLSPLPPLPGESPSSPTANISPLPPLPGEISPSLVLPEVAALASVRGSVKELEHLQHSLDTHSSSTSSPVPEERIEPRLISEELQTIVQKLGQEGGGEGGGEGDGRLEEQGNGQPWEPKTQWEDNMDERERGGEVERPGRKGKIWSFLEEKTRLSNEERELAVTSKPATSRKMPPPKVLPKPVRKKSASDGQPPPSQPQVKPEEEAEGERGGQEEEPDVPHVNGPIPSPDPNIITIQSTSSSEPLNIRAITEDEAELHGDIKIQKVGRTRWTPQKKSPEEVQRRMSTPSHSVPRPPAGGLEQQPQHYEESRPVKRYAGTPPTHQVGLPGAPPTHQVGLPGAPPTHQVGLPGAPPTHPGPIRQRSMPHYLTHNQQRARRIKPPQHPLITPPHTPQHPQQQWGMRGQPQSRQLAEQTRISGTMPATFRGRIQSATTPVQANGGPSYDSLANAVREVKQLNTQQQNAKLRSQTWGARERNKFLGQPKQGGRPALALPEQKQDGLQQAFLVRPADPHLPCSLCHKPVGPQLLIAIPGLHLHYHPYCFVCPVCHTFLAPSTGHSSTTVMVRSMRPHCHYCTSNPQGVQATEC